MKLYKTYIKNIVFLSIWFIGSVYIEGTILPSTQAVPLSCTKIGK